MLHLDAVVVGSIISVLIAVVIVVFLVYKVIKLMNEDAKRHADEGQS
jgi:large-conductance mechanosensitive channel